MKNGKTWVLVASMLAAACGGEANDDSGAGGTGGTSPAATGGAPEPHTGGMPPTGAGGLLPTVPEPGPPLGTPCPLSASVEPLDDACGEDVCHLAIRLDVHTLGILGYASIGGPRAPIGETEAKAAYDAEFDGKPSFGADTADAAEAGIILAEKSPGDFGGFAIVGEESGRVITSGTVVWAGKGQYLRPVTWSDPGRVACGVQPVKPDRSYIHPRRCTSCGYRFTPRAASEALNTALLTNLAAHYAKKSDLSAFVYLYEAEAGSVYPTTAEYVVVLSGTSP